MPAKVILLDIDDCISCDRSIRACRAFDDRSLPGYRIPQTADRVAVDLLNRACTICDTRIVVSSTWIDVAGPAYTIDWLSRNGLMREHFLADDACVNYRPHGGKREAIEDWLKQNSGLAADRMVVVDDDAELFPAGHPLAERQVIIDGEDGILLRHYREIITKLGGIDKEAGKS